MENLEIMTEFEETPDQTEDQPDPDTPVDAFAQLLDEYEQRLPRRGQILEGEVVHVDDEGVLIDVGAKRDALVPTRELKDLDEELLEDISVGDQIPVYVTQTAKFSDDLVVSIDKGLQYEDWQAAKGYLESGEALELQVVDKNRGGLLVKFGRLQGFVPNSHILDIRRSANRQTAESAKAEKIGTDLLLKVIEVDGDRNRLILSERKAQSERRQQRLEELEAGLQLKGRVVNLVNFGAFVNLEGIDGLIHISELSWERVDHPSEVLNVGEEVQVVVKDVDRERERISLSRKALLPSPWESILDRYAVGDLVEGTVTSVRDFGAFVRLGAGIEGLIHVSEMGVPQGESPKDVLQAEDTVLTRIIEIDPDRERIGLSLAQVKEEESLAWMMKQYESQQGDEPELPEGERESQATNLAPGAAAGPEPSEAAPAEDPAPGAVAETAPEEAPPAATGVVEGEQAVIAEAGEASPESPAALADSDLSAQAQADEEPASEVEAGAEVEGPESAEEAEDPAEHSGSG